jgi:hypothetical protein
MSFFQFPNATSSQASLNVPAGTAPASPVDGDIWYDTTQKTGKISWNGVNYVIGGVAQVVNVAPAALAALTGTGTFSTITLPTGFMNIPGKGVRVRMWGIYSSAAAQTPTIGIQLGFSGAFTQTVVVATSQAITASQTNFPWTFTADVYTATNGATGTIEAHGQLAILLGSVATAPMSIYQDANVAPGGAINLTAGGTNNLLLQAVTSTAVVINTASYSVN